MCRVGGGGVNEINFPNCLLGIGGVAVKCHCGNATMRRAGVDLAIRGRSEARQMLEGARQWDCEAYLSACVLKTI